jgi:hypothetical protein
MTRSIFHVDFLCAWIMLKIVMHSMASNQGITEEAIKGIGQRNHHPAAEKPGSERGRKAACGRETSGSSEAQEELLPSG